MTVHSPHRFRRVSPVLALTMLLGFASSAPAASKIIMRGSAEDVQGDITAVSKTEVTYKRGIAKPETIPVNQIEAIEWDGMPLDIAKAKNLERGGKLSEAVEAYRAGLQAAKEDNQKAEAAFLVARTLAKIAQTDPEQIDAAITELSGYRTKYADFYRYFDSLKWLGRIAMKKGDAELARSAFDELAKAPFQDYKMEAEVNQAKLKLQQGNIDAALSQFKSVADMKAENELQTQQRVAAMLGQAEALYQQKKYAPALDQLNRVTTEGDSGDTQLQGTAFLRKGDCHLAAGQQKDALMAYLHVDVLFFMEPDLHAEALYHLSSLWRTVGKPERANEATTKLRAEYPNSEWAKKLDG